MRDDRFERLYAKHAGPLLGFLVYRTGDRMLAEDLLSDTFERVLKARRPFDPRKASEKTWIYTIALNCLRDHVRRAGVESRSLEAVATPASEGAHRKDPLASVDDRDAIARAFEVLSAEEREAIALRYGADLTVPEIAKLASESLSTVEGRIYRGLRKLRKELG
jgi:RNA polymerase sigma factor (sigma-70 family)